MPLLQDKVCIVTGGAGSIGLESAILMAEEGARVVLVDLSEERLKAAVKSFPSGRADYAIADVSRAADVKAYVEKAVKRFGKIDVLFSNAGNPGAVGAITEYPEDVFDQVFAVHVRGAFLACKYGLPAMNDGGSLIITSSVAAFLGSEGPYAYIPAKAAQVALMRCVAKEAAHRRIRVNTIHPGPVDNEFQLGIEKNIGAFIHQDATALFDQLIPLGRHATAREVAKSVLYLASDQSSFVTGTTLRVDGGMSA
ncbi:MAG TPA: SDR family oxidoreductase [Nitrobacter sp.]|nr:SDR family oxidoreductase [Nitrobacter sp.]